MSSISRPPETAGARRFVAICAAGSLLGVTHPTSAFPVGQVEFLDLYPMSFEEYLDACATDAEVDFYRRANAAMPVSEAVHQRMMEHLKSYLVTGGMPGILRAWVGSELPLAERLVMIRHEQRQLLESYVGNFAKYSGRLSASLVHDVYRSIPAQLARESRRFKPGLVASSTRFERLRHPVAWLVGAGLLVRVPIIEHVELPLLAFADELAHRATAMLSLPLWLAGRFRDTDAWWGKRAPAPTTPPQNG